MATMKLEFFVHGAPVTQGSLKIINGRIVHISGPKLKAWRNDIAQMARILMPAPEPLADCGFDVEVDFMLARPKSVPERKRSDPWVKPDADKLLRAVLDALEGVVFKNDSQALRVVSEKRYVEPGAEGALITVTRRAPPVHIR